MNFDKWFYLGIMLRLFIVPFLLAFTFSQAKAEDYRLRCTVTEKSSQGKASKPYRIRIEIDLEPRYFKYAVEEGGTTKNARSAFPKDVSAALVIIASDEVIEEHFDRRNHEYFYRNADTGIEVKGQCSPLSK